MPYTTVLFDLDHTLMDSHASHAAAFDVTMRSIGLDDPASVHVVFDRINQALWRRVEGHEISPNEVKSLRFRQLLDELALDGDPVEMGARFAAGLTDHGELYEGAALLLTELAARCRLALVTNGIGPVQRGRLDRLGLGDAFEVVSISGELGTSKPGRAIFDHTLDELGVNDRSSAVMIGDSMASDIQGGINAGLDTIWFNPNAAIPPHGVAPTHEVAALESIAHLVTGCDER
jgi:YjjG family noncanonical pyrimidine nucleotidase